MSDNKSIIQLFQENELRISELYALYSQIISGYKIFWKKISQEEIGHAKEIANINLPGQECFEENNFTRGVIKYISDFVAEKIEEAKTKKLTHLEAVNNALRLEQSMLEKKCFDVFIPTQITIKNVLERMNQETNRHVERLQKELEKQTR